MKKFLVVFWLIVLMTFAFGQNWELVQEGNTDAYPNALDFIDANTGIFVGDDGVVVKTTDGGLNGETIRMPDESGIDWKGVGFANANVGYAIANDSKSGNPDGYIFKTTDGGLNWTMVADTAHFTSELNGISVVNENLVYIIGDDSLFLTTVDGGAIWNKNTFSFDGEDLDGGVAFLNADSGVVAVDNKSNPISWYTHDGGVSWNPVMIEFPMGTISARIYDVAAGGKSTIALVGYHETAFVSHDAGMSYSLTNDVDFGYVYFNSATVVDDNTIYATGRNGDLIKTSNGGSSWDVLNSGSGQTSQDMDFVSADIGYIFQAYGQWFKTVNGGLDWTPLLDWPNVSFWGMALPADDKIVLTAWGGGELTMSTDAGLNWTYPDNMATGIKDNIYECEFLDENTGLIAGGSGYVLRTTDGGTSWTEIANPLFDAGKTINALSIVNGNTILAGGSSGKMQKSVDGGLTWNEIKNTGTSTVYDFWPINENQVIASASSGKIYLSNAAVDTFTQVKDYGSMSMRAVEFRGDVGLVCASSGHMYRTTVANWDTLVEVFKEPAGEDFYDLEFITDSLVYVVGEHGIIYKSEDAGLNWAKEDSVTNVTLQKIKFRNNRLWAVGQRGTVLMAAITPVGIKGNSDIVAMDYDLKQNYPNPFNPLTTINFSLKKAGHVTLTVYNTRGQKISTLLDQELKAGAGTVDWNASNMASGVYFYKLSSPGFVSVKKMLLVK